MNAEMTQMQKLRRLQEMVRWQNRLDEVYELDEFDERFGEEFCKLQSELASEWLPVVQLLASVGLLRCYIDDEYGHFVKPEYSGIGGMVTKVYIDGDICMNIAVAFPQDRREASPR